MKDSNHINLHEDRYDRLRSIQWWDQERLASARILVVGAGALGNEVIKNLALLGIGSLVIVDLDVVEESNLSRSILYREVDIGRPKAECAAAAAISINPDVQAVPLVGDVTVDLGLGTVRQADIIIGALDNREARVHLNKACYLADRTWIDGGIEILSGIVRSFHPPATACYECTMGETDLAVLNQKRSCSLMARLALTSRGTPTTPLSASYTGAFQALEAVKLLHGMKDNLGRGFRIDGSGMEMLAIEFPAVPDCFCRSGSPPILAAPELSSDSSLADIMARAATELGGFDVLELGRDFVESLACNGCGTINEVLRPAAKIPAHQLACPTCGDELDPVFVGALGTDHILLQRTPRDLGLPGQEILWTRRNTDYLGIELRGDPSLWPGPKGKDG